MDSRDDGHTAGSRDGRGDGPLPLPAPGPNAAGLGRSAGPGPRSRGGVGPGPEPAFTCIASDAWHHTGIDGGHVQACAAASGAVGFPGALPEPFGVPFPASTPRAASVAALRAGYRDPAKAQLMPAGPLFDAVSADLPLGLDALDLMLRAGAPVGPVAVDARTQVRRVGFLLPPDTLARARGLAFWCRDHGLRLASHGAVLVLPPLIGDADARLHWLVSPDQCTTAYAADAYPAAPYLADASATNPGVNDGTVPATTDPATLLGALRRALRTSARIAAAVAASTALTAY